MSAQSLQAARLGISLVQGLLLLALYKAASLQACPATNALVFAPLATSAVFVPLVAISSLGNVRSRTLLIWTIAAVVVCAGLAIYDIFRDPTDVARISDLFPGGYPRNVPSFELWFGLASLLFIAHALIVSADPGRQVIAPYPVYFDTSWKHGIQAKLSVLFVGVFWAILLLGASLFALIKIDLVWDIIKQEYCWIPLSAIVTGYALHLTDTRAGLTRGTRTLVLLLLSWLLPVMTLLAIGFIVALPFAGLDALWSTRRAGSILLGTTAMLIFLINAAYQDGQDEQPAPLRYARLAASVVLLPLMALAGYALMLRVQQYGWTPQRVIDAALITIGTCYAFGYLYATARSGLPLRDLETVNVVTAFVIVAVGLILLTPVADPVRISVDSQVARLNAGKVTPEQFDFVFLKFDSGRYGRAALAALAARTGDSTVQDVAQRATRMLAQKERYQAVVTLRAPVTPEQRAARITVAYPAGASLPDSFVRENWAPAYTGPPCLTGSGECDAVLLDLDGDGQNEIVLLARPNGYGTVFKQDGDAWKSLGVLANSQCPGMRDALRDGKFELKDSPRKDIVVNGQRIWLNDTGCIRRN